METIKRAPVLVLTGPAAVGKNTIAGNVAESVPKLAIVDVDVVRWMYFKPHFAPWGGHDGLRQQELGVRNACALARNFVEEGVPTLLLDVVTNRTAALYREYLAGLSPIIVLVLPDWSVVEERLLARPHTITFDEAKLVYEWQRDLNDFDYRIDNNDASAAEIAREVIQLISPPHNSRVHPPASGG